jgi:V8-like Glu-specific endopeptidase
MPGEPASLPGGEQAIVTKVKPGLAIISTTPRYDSEAAAGTGMVINADRLVLTNNHVIDEPTITVSNEGGSMASGTLDGMIQANADTWPGNSGSPFLGMSTCSVCTLICRVKALKRQMFGRANLDLLRKGILLRT